MLFKKKTKIVENNALIYNSCPCQQGLTQLVSNELDKDTSSIPVADMRASLVDNFKVQLLFEFGGHVLILVE